jgi:hypothetical protein
MKRSLWVIALVVSCALIGCSGGDDAGFQEPPKAATGGASGNQPIVSAAEGEGGQPANDPSSAGASFGGGRKR